MDSGDSKSQDHVQLRRSKRRKAVKDVSYEATPRGPIRRTKRKLEERSSTQVINGDGVLENGLEDDESPSKQSRRDAGVAGGDKVKDIEMDKQESDEEMETTEDQEIKTVKDSKQIKELKVPQTTKGISDEKILSPYVELGQRCRQSHSLQKNSISVNLKETFSKTRHQTAPPTTAPSQVTTSGIRLATRLPSTDDYQRELAAKARSFGAPRVDRMVLKPEVSLTTRLHMRNIPPQAGKTLPPNKEKKNPRVVKESFGNSRPGFSWYLWRLIFLVLLSSATLLAYKILPALQRTAGGGEAPSRAQRLGTFSDQLSRLQAEFPSQRPDLWKRSKVHLEKHLKTGQPSEPVSMILAAGADAERTLLCLARGFAASFSSALNASFLLMDGARKAGQDSDAVKLDIDNQLRAAFEGDQPAAVIHHFEALPPGSTIIFYRYCDHENAAYKRVFLLFTVLLPRRELSPELSLKEVEEAVQTFVQDKLVGSGGQTAFDKMDIDKFGGLWSRISHLVLPVASEAASEAASEQHGCPSNETT
ncbi:torsin-1A-interacting protein 1 isoform X2 [Oryzias melastigma]|uniref:torsin-1A-interacting protein 1 isoform X2 n=1 Tax=Oryzias melastigma TaxID=30732 RepID=UPI000CF7B5BD|nr:torsin-1A-interacting protein 1 isoform X2 [Oryzias melastigma]